MVGSILLKSWGLLALSAAMITHSLVVRSCLNWDMETPVSEFGFRNANLGIQNIGRNPITKSGEKQIALLFALSPFSFTRHSPILIPHSKCLNLRPRITRSTLLRGSIYTGYTWALRSSRCFGLDSSGQTRQLLPDLHPIRSSKASSLRDIKIPF